MNPYYEENDVGAMINEDKLIVETFDKWEFGYDNTGNIMSVQNIRKIWERAQNHPFGLPSFITCDGSIDCQSDPNDQVCFFFVLFFSPVCVYVPSFSFFSLPFFDRDPFIFNNNRKK